MRPLSRGHKKTGRSRGLSKKEKKRMKRDDKKRALRIIYRRCHSERVTKIRHFTNEEILYPPIRSESFV